MPDATMPCLPMINLDDADCALCTGLNSLYQQNVFQQEMRVPENIGEGHFTRIIVKPSIEIAICDMTFHQDITIGRKPGESRPVYDLSFCLGGRMQWASKDHTREYDVTHGDSCIFNHEDSFSMVDIHSGQHFSYINIGISVDAIEEICRHAEIDGRFFAAQNINRVNKNKNSIAIKRIIHDMIHCRLAGGLKQIYLEAKVIELLAVYIDELLLEDKTMQAPSLSREDMAGIRKAKNILDADIANAPSLGELKRMACLNECKLQTGFKRLYGMTVHAYIIDQRLETARYLLESRDIRVSEAAQYVGYNELGQFAEKFKKKFGVSPSEFNKNM